MSEMDTSLKQTCFVMLLYLLQIGVMVTVYPKLIMANTPDDSVAALWNGALTGTKSALEFVVMPVAGAYSDHCGRKPLFLVCSAVALLELSVVAAVPTMVVVATTRVLGGLSNGVFTMGYAAIADVSRAASDAKMAQNFGLVGACFGVAFIVGPVLGGALGAIDTSLPCWLAAALAAANILFIFFFWDETLHHDDRRPFAWANANPLPALRVFLHRPALTALVPPFFLSHLGSCVVYLWFIYAHARYGWDQAQVGIFISCAGVTIAVVQGCLIRRLVPAVLSEPAAVVLGYAGRAATYFAYGMASEPGLLYLIVVPDALTTVADPSIYALMVRNVGSDMFGALQGACDSLRTLAVAAGVPCFSVVLSWSISPAAAERVGPGAPGLPWVLASALFCVAATVASNAFKRHPCGPREAAGTEALELLGEGDAVAAAASAGGLPVPAKGDLVADGRAGKRAVAGVRKGSAAEGDTGEDQL